MRLTLAFFGFAFALFALVSQSVISIGADMETGFNFVQACINFISSLTILTTAAMVVLFFSAIVKGQRWLWFARKPITRSTLATMITIAAVYHHQILAPSDETQGIEKLLVIMLNYICPAIYLGWVIRFNRSGTLKFEQAIPMLIAPLCYVAYVLFRGEITWQYPYAVLNARNLGYYPTVQNIALLAIALLVLNIIYIIIDRAVIAGEKASS